MSETKLISLAAFLASVPPGEKRMVADLCKSRHGPPELPPIFDLNTPDIKLHCPTDTCSGERNFICVAPGEEVKGIVIKKNVFLTYICRNCRGFNKIYAIRVDGPKKLSIVSGSVMKFGEIPGFGPPLPSSLISMVRQDRELFLKGGRAEKQGLGIGSFAYYRRVVENQKDQILSELHKAAQRLNADEELLDSIVRAKNEKQFTRSINLVKDAIPESLKVNGYNPLKLLHNALSKGVHSLSDQECLEQAQAVRVILVEFVSNIARATAEKREVDAAISRLKL